MRNTTEERATPLRINNPSRLLSVLLLLIALTAAYEVGFMAASLRGGQTAMVAGNACTYAIFTDGKYTYAQNCGTGAIDYGGPSNLGGATGNLPETVINLAIAHGGKIFIKAGTYTFTTTPIIVAGASPAAIGTTSVNDVELFGEGDSTILKGGTGLSGTFELIAVANARDWYIHDLQVDGNAEQQSNSVYCSGILLWNTDNSTIQNVVVHDNKNVGIDTEKSTSINILNNYVKDSYANGIEVTAGSNLLIQGNTVDGSSDVGISISGDNAISGGDPVTNVICTGNIIYHLNLGLSPYHSNAAVGIDIGDNGFATHVIASENQIHGPGQDGVEVNPGLGTDADITVSNNQVGNESLQGVYGTLTSELLITSNLVQNSGAEGILTTSSVTGLSVSNNSVNATSNIGIYIQTPNALVNDNNVQVAHRAILTTGLNTDIVGNVILGSYGISLDTGSNASQAIGNYVHATDQGITVSSSDDTVSNNRIYPAAIGAIVIAGGAVGTVVNGNDVRDITYPMRDSGTNTVITSNAGYNPLGRINAPFVSSSKTILDGGGSSFPVNATTMTVWESPKTISVLISSSFTTGHTFVLQIDGTQIVSANAPVAEERPYVFKLQPGQTFYCQYQAGMVTFAVSGE
jgi:parallel beta-helix repeat protein